MISGMEISAFIICSAATLIILLLYCEYTKHRKGIIAVKSICSLLFVITAIIQPHFIPSYYHYVLAGLVLCLSGDVFLAVPRHDTFLYGLIAFLLGHLLYIFGFISVAKSGQELWIVSFVVVAVSVFVYGRIFPYLASMKISVLVYVAVISVMLIAAWSVMSNPSLGKSGRSMVFFGAFFFYISDMFVARDRFYRKEFSNRFFGLPLYYSGQFLLALSIGFLK